MNLEKFKMELERMTTKQLGIMLSAGYKGEEHNLISREYMRRKCSQK